MSELGILSFFLGILLLGIALKIVKTIGKLALIAIIALAIIFFVSGGILIF